MTTFEDAARGEAERREVAAQRATTAWALRQGWPVTGTEAGAYEQGHLAGSAWVRDHLAEQEPSDAEVRVMAQHMAHAASDWVDWETDQHDHEPSCSNWTAYTDDARRALREAARARRDHA